MQTFEPLSVPSYTLPGPPEAIGWRPIFRSEGESVYEVGSIVLVPHMLLSSRRHFRKPELAGSRLSRAYAGSSRERGRDIGATHLVEIVNKRHKFIPAKIRHVFLVRFAVEDVVELIVELGRRPIEVVELLQYHRTWLGGGGCPLAR